MDRDKLGERLSAYFDGELSDQDRAAVEATLRDDPSARAELARLRDTAHAMSELPRQKAPGLLAADVMATIERGDLLGDVPSPPKKRGWLWRSSNALLMTAAMITVAITVGLWGILQSETQQSDSLAVSEAVLGKVEREILPSDPRRDTASRGREVSPESRSDELVAPPVVAMTSRSAPTDYDDAEIGETPQSPQPAKKAKPARRGGRARSSSTDGASVAMDVRFDVTCPNVVDLHWCVYRVNRFMDPDEPEPRGKFRDSNTKLPPYLAESTVVESGVVTVERMIRIRPSRLSSFIDALEAGASQERGVALTIGTMVQARGWRQSKQLSEMVYGRVSHDELRQLAKQPYVKESPARREDQLTDHTESIAVPSATSSADEDDAKMINGKKVIDGWLERFGVLIPHASESQEPPSATIDFVEQDPRPAWPSEPPRLIAVIVRFHAPANFPPPGLPGQLVPRNR